MEALAWVIGIVSALFLLVRFPRPSLIFVGVLIVIGALVGGFIYVMDELTKRNVAKVVATITYDLERCSSEFPLSIWIMNGSDSTVEKVSWNVEGHEEGFSDTLYESSYSRYSSDRIIASGDGWGICWELPPQAYGVSEQKIFRNPLQNVVWTVTDIRPTFQNR